LPQKGEGEIRAFVDSWGADVSVALNASLLGGDQSFHKEFHVKLAVGSAKNHLLYYHTLALADPVSMLVEDIHPKGACHQRLSPGPADERLMMSKRCLKSAVSILTQIEPFVRRRLIYLYNAPAVLSFLPQLGALREFMHSHQEYRDLATHYETQWLLPDTDHRWALLHARMMLASLLGCDFVPSSLYDWDVIDLDLRVLGDTLSSSCVGADLFRSGVLSLVDLPGLEGVSAGELMKIREDEEAFQRWRSDLTHVIMHLCTRPVHSTSMGREFLQIARDLLAPRAREINKSLSKKWRLRSHLRTAAFAFCSSTATAIAGGLDLASCLRVAGAGASAAVLFSVLFGNPPRHDRRVSKLYTAIVDRSAGDYGMTRVA
jgi:hypothetical protein